MQQAPQEIPVPPWMAAGDGVAGPGPEPAEGPGSPATPDGLERGTYPDGTDYGPGRAPIAIADLPDALDEPDEPAGAGAGADGPADPVTQVDSERDPSAGCRYLVAASGGWRASDAIRDHRCTALDPAAPIALDKQRRLCLTATHPTCPTFIAARDERGRALDPVASAWSPARPVVQTAPVVVGVPTHERPMAGLFGPARLGEAALGLMAVVVVVLLGARLLGGQGAPEASPTADLTGGGSIAPGETATIAASPSTTHAGGATEPPAGSAGPDASSPAQASPEPKPSGRASPGASSKPSPTAHRRYKVKLGDTVSAIAEKYGTTVAAIVKLNKLKDARTIHVGQVLLIP